MKNPGIITVFIAAGLLFACQTTVDEKAEKQAIIDVINAETEAYMNFDLEKVLSYYVQDSLNFRITIGADDHVFLEGLDQIKAFFQDDLLDSNPESPADTRIHVSKDNYRIRLYENSAYVVCNEKWTYTMPDDTIEIDSRQVRFMEKVDGEWKITFLSFVGTSGYDEELELEERGMGYNKVFR
jgi:ketosteroid isomerase-like protein